MSKFPPELRRITTAFGVGRCVPVARNFRGIVAAGFDEPTVRRVVRLIDHSEYKRRQASPCLKVTTKAFGIGRRIPIAQRYQQ